MAISYSEYDESPTLERTTRDGFDATRELMVAWDDRNALIDLLVGTAQIYPHKPATFATAYEGEARPFPGGKNLGTGGTESVFEWALVTIKYTNRRELSPDPTRNEERLQPTAENLVLSHLGFVWDSDGVALVEGENPVKFLPGMEYIITAHEIISLGTDIRDLVGKVNDANISPTSDGLTNLVFQAECLLFNPPTIDRVYRADGSAAWDVTFNFQDKPNWDDSVAPQVARGWNYYWRTRKVNGAVVGRFDQIKDPVTGNVYKAFPPADFSVL